MSDIDLSLNDPTEIVHAVCDLAAGRRVRMTWSSDGGELAPPTPDTPAVLGVLATAVANFRTLLAVAAHDAIRGGR